MQLPTAQRENFHTLQPPTAAAILHVLDVEHVVVKGSRVAVIGEGDLVGKPVSAMLIARGANVSVANSSTKNVAEMCLSADIIVSAAGSPGIITAGMVSSHAVVIDAGTSDTTSGISGDVDFANVAAKVAAIAPVPGGIGPVAVAMLMANVAKVAASARV